MTAQQRKIFVKLLGQETKAWRPTLAEDVGEGLFKILPTPDYNPENENWEFPPGSTVKIEEQDIPGGNIFQHVETKGRWLAKASIATPLNFAIRREWRGYRLCVNKDGKGIIGYLLTNINEAKQHALRQYGLPVSEWKRVGLFSWEAKIIRSAVECEIIEDYFKTILGEEHYIYTLNVLEEGYGLFDYQQDTLDVAMRQAHREFHVPLDAWQVA